MINPAVYPIKRPVFDLNHSKLIFCAAQVAKLMGEKHDMWQGMTIFASGLMVTWRNIFIVVALVVSFDFLASNLFILLFKEALRY